MHPSHPIACSLDPSSAHDRIDTWHRLLTGAERAPISDGLRLQLQPDAPLAEITELAAAEHDCCRFLSFALTIDDRGVALEVTAPTDARTMLDDIFGPDATEPR